MLTDRYSSILITYSRENTIAKYKNSQGMAETTQRSLILQDYQASLHSCASLPTAASAIKPSFFSPIRFFLSSLRPSQHDQEVREDCPAQRCRTLCQQPASIPRDPAACMFENRVDVEMASNGMLGLHSKVVKVRSQCIDRSRYTGCAAGMPSTRRSFQVLGCVLDQQVPHSLFA
jgi:hypothetical protein